ncbi:kinetoplast-associated protein 1-like [Melospiza georgiana]|uniref:kinetoplast-associated protein 1-like n=1 Tax=Melospiza georgiana TaxID=44398 RepID=UPI0025AC596D|nr:kinetoplast-associated protein 1-like [Melospiza georgiana]
MVQPRARSASAGAMERGRRGASGAAGPLRGTAGPLARRFPWRVSAAAPRPGPRWRRSASAATTAPPPSCNPARAAFLFLPARARAPLAGATAAARCRRAADGTAATGAGPRAGPARAPSRRRGGNGEGATKWRLPSPAAGCGRRAVFAHLRRLKG